MESFSAELMQGPKSEAFADQVTWFKKLHETCSKSTDPLVKKCAPPLKSAVALLTKVSKSKKDQDSQETVTALTGYVLMTQGLALHGYLETLTEIRMKVAQQASKEKNAKVKKDMLATQGAVEQLIVGLSKVYQALREAKFKEMDKAAQLVVDAQKVFAKLKA